jgi:hypothetical protein
MRTSSRSLCLLAAFTLAACEGKGEPIQEVCELAQSCECEPPPYADVETCVTALNAEVDEYKAEAEMYGLQFAQQCLDRILEGLDGLGCDNVYSGSTACVICAAVHGDKAEGAACTMYGEYSDCARDLRCNEGVCVDDCKLLQAGENCVSAGVFARCADGLYCDGGGTQTCLALLAPGDQCPTGAGCPTGNWCDPADTTCKALPKTGEACTVLCEPAATCAEGTCQPRPAAGQPCLNQQCVFGASCDNGTCVEDPPLICAIND